MISTLYKVIYYIKESYLDVINNLKTLKFDNDIPHEIDRVNLLAKSYDKIDDIENAFSYFEKTNLLNSNIKSKEIDKNRFLNEKKRTEYFKKINKIKSFLLKCSPNINQYLCLVFRDLEQHF